MRGARRAAHPRSRGENLAPRSPRADAAGSSPLTRGKHMVSTTVRAMAGLIPAHAGKTPSRQVPDERPTAHPRSRGENRRLAFTSSRTTGSSPLTRGKRSAHVPQFRDARLIPAHAGKTVPSGRMRLKPGAHPRSRGENRFRGSESFRVSGSSPLTRGKRGGGRRARRGGRLIPAHAGKTRR